MSSISECCLCSQIEGRRDNDLIARLLPGEPHERRILLESQSFAVIPDVGALAPGHSLLCPKAHVRSFASLDPRFDAEYDVIKARLTTALRDRYDNGVTIFEHGMAASGDHVPCTINHAHMHFVPLPGTIEFEGDAIEGSLQSLRQWAGGREYIYCETPGGVSRLLRDREFESQHMRKLVARALGNADRWDWRDTPNPRAADDIWRTFARV